MAGQITTRSSIRSLSCINDQPSSSLSQTTNIHLSSDENDQEIGTGKNHCWTGTRTANIPAVMPAAAGANFKLIEAFNLKVLSATVKCNHAGEIAGIRKLYENMESIDGGDSDTTLIGSGYGVRVPRMIYGAFPQHPQPKKIYLMIYYLRSL